MLLRAVSAASGSIRFNDHGKMVDVLSLEGELLQSFRRKVQFIFQDPFGSLNPRMTVFDIISEPLVIHGIGTAPVKATQSLSERVGALFLQDAWGKSVKGPQAPLTFTATLS